MTQFGPYVLDAIGTPLGSGATNPQHCSIAGVLKRNTPHQSYVVANEFICGRLALLIGLNVPPGVMVRTEDGELVYVSLFFGSSGRELPPPIDAQELVAAHPYIAAGIVVFDCWIANTDRHEANLAFLPPSLPVTIFDHSHALLGAGSDGSGVAQLESAKNKAFVSDCLHQHLNNAAHLFGWQARIRDVPDELIAELCNAAAEEGAITSQEATETSAFLADRKGRIISLLKTAQSDQGCLPGVSQWGLEE